MSAAVSVVRRRLDPRPTRTPGFSLRLDNFEGPFDLLLQLISKHKLDITEVALSVVTVGLHRLQRGEPEDDLEQTTYFLLIAATLLDLKTARLLPQAEVEDEEDLALLEARDLLFARLMQYRAFKKVAAILAERCENESLRHPRAVALEPRFATPAARGGDRHRARAPRRRWPPGRWRPSRCPWCCCTTSTRPRSACASRPHLVVDRLRREGSMTFRAIVRRRARRPDQGGAVPRRCSSCSARACCRSSRPCPLGELTVRWTGTDDGDIDVGDEFDEPTLTDEGPMRRTDAPTDRDHRK